MLLLLCWWIWLDCNTSVELLCVYSSHPTFGWTRNMDRRVHHLRSTSFNIVEFRMLNTFGYRVEWCWFYFSLFSDRNNNVEFLQPLFWTSYNKLVLNSVDSTFPCFQIETTMFDSFSHSFEHRSTNLCSTVLNSVDSTVLYFNFNVETTMFNSFSHSFEHRTTNLCSTMLNDIAFDWLRAECWK